MFRRKRAPNPPPGTPGPSAGLPPPVVVDVYYGVPAGHRCAAAIARMDWDTARAELTSVDWASTVHIALGLAELRELEGAIESWMAAAPHDAVASALAGFRQVNRAWEARGGGYAQDVTAEQYDEFFASLLRAEERFARAWKLDPAMPLTWRGMLWSGIGLQIPAQELRLRFDQAKAIMPDSVQLHLALQQGLCAKWKGSDDEMLAFTNDIVATAPSGSPLHLLQAVAHFELASVSEGDWRAHLQQRAGAIREAAANSVEHPEFAARGSHPDCVLARNWFALLYQVIGDRAAAGRQRAALGGSIGPRPWSYFGEPVAGWQEFS